MALLNILHYPDPRLRTVAKPVVEFTEEVQVHVANMFETMYAAPGIGLASTQVNVHQQIITIDVSETKNQPLCLINPVIQEKLGTEQMDEGCLSVPGIFETVERAMKIVVSANDQYGKSFTLETDGLLAVCIQHEMDHLLGKLFVDYLSLLKRTRIRKKLEKERSHTL